jgi:hypothetical protein
VEEGEEADDMRNERRRRSEDTEIRWARMYRSMCWSAGENKCHSMGEQVMVRTTEPYRRRMNKPSGPRGQRRKRTIGGKKEMRNEQEREDEEEAKEVEDETWQEELTGKVEAEDEDEDEAAEAMIGWVVTFIRSPRPTGIATPFVSVP